MSEFLEQKQTEIFQKYDAFFAFGKEQFTQARKEGIKYAHVGMNLFCPAEYADNLVKELNEAHDLSIHLEVKRKGALQIIKHAYFNYETQISMDTSDMLESLERYKQMYPDLFTDKFICRVTRYCFHLACKNDWF